MRVYTRQFSKPVADLGAGPDTSNKPPKHECDDGSDAHHQHQGTDAVTQGRRSTRCGADPEEDEEMSVRMTQSLEEGASNPSLEGS